MSTETIEHPERRSGDLQVVPFPAVRQLSTQETRVLSKLEHGLTSKEIVAQLGLSVRTVEHTLERAYAKLSVHTRAAAAVRFGEWRCSDGGDARQS